MITLDNVCKSYGAGDGLVEALKNVSLEIPSGKFVAIIGKSGCGKSTLLNMIGALDKSTSGTVHIAGINLSDLSNNQLSDYRNKNVGFVFQSFYLEPHFTVLENVEMPLVIAGMDKAERKQKAIEMITSFGLDDKTNKRVSTLSGGQKQRVSIARALVHSPSLILADEPTGNLDSKNGAEVIAALRQIAEGGRTVILVTHNADDASKTDCIIEIADGEIVSINDKNPANPVCGKIGSIGNMASIECSVNSNSSSESTDNNRVNAGDGANSGDISGDNTSGNKSRASSNDEAAASGGDYEKITE